MSVTVLFIATVARQGFGEVEFAGWEVLRYYVYLYLTRFADYPWVVTTAYTISLLTVFGLLTLSVTALLSNLINARRRRYYHRLCKKYEERLTNIVTDTKRWSVYDVSDRLEVDGSDGRPKKHRRWQSAQWFRFLERVKRLNEQRVSQENIDACVSALRFGEYVEWCLRFGHRGRRLSVLRSAEYLGMNLQSSVTVRLLNDRDERLRKAVRTNYMRNSVDDPYRFLSDNTVDKFTRWDAIEMHQLFIERKAHGKPMPPMLPIARNVADKGLAAFLIRETAYWGDDQEMDGVQEFFDSSDEECRKAAFESVGIRQWSKAEPVLKAKYGEQSEPLRRVIMESLLSIHTGSALPFFRECYASAVSVFTKETALRCILLYGVKGQTQFLQMKSRASDTDLRLFNHVESMLAYRNSRFNVSIDSMTSKI